jgi:CheY-like chemotaxis protein
VPIVVITVVDDRKIRYDALEAGATDFLIKPLDEHETRARCANLLELRRHKIVLSDQARVLQYQVDKSVSEIHERELETLAKLAKAGEFRDKTTGNHLMRMAKYSALIGQHLGLGAETGPRARGRGADARHRQDRHSRRRAAEGRPADEARGRRDEDPSPDGLRHPEGQPVEVPFDGCDHRARSSREVRRFRLSERPARRRHSAGCAASWRLPTSSTH